MDTVVKRNEAARLIQGVLLKCVDERWTDADGLTPQAQMLALGTKREPLPRSATPCFSTRRASPGGSNE